jgi:hypothetical protein
VNSFGNTLARKGLFTKTALDVVQNLRMSRVRLVKNVLQRKIRCAETVAEMLCKNPTTICGLLNNVMSSRNEKETYKRRRRLGRRGGTRQRRRRGCRGDNRAAKLLS